MCHCTSDAEYEMWLKKIREASKKPAEQKPVLTVTA